MDSTLKEICTEEDNIFLEKMTSKEIDFDKKDIMKDMCVNQGYVPKTCLLPGPMIFALTTDNGDSCKGCCANRLICNGRKA